MIAHRSSRKIASVILGLLIALGMVVTGSSPAAATVDEHVPMHRMPAGTVYAFMAAHLNWSNGSQRMLAQLTSNGKATSNDTGVYLYDHGHIQDASQAWEWIPETAGHSITDGWGQLRNRWTGQCLDVSGGSTADGADVIGWSCNGTDNQKFKAVDLGDGYDFKLVAKHSNKPIGTTAAHCAPNNGNSIHQLSTTVINCQKWRITRSAYRFATDDIDVKWGNLYEIDTADYTCLPGYKFRAAPDSALLPRQPRWSDDIGEIKDGHAFESIRADLDGGKAIVRSIQYVHHTSPYHQWGQIYLFCDPVADSVAGIVGGPGN
ncbi:RICIN domain-containing protein [Streptomyces chartreusis]|uniref:RICIN domain-containing protein n=1 Tax=Streptomyces chartreusis TaxID=1969 RepID=UPI0034106EE8